MVSMFSFSRNIAIWSNGNYTKHDKTSAIYVACMKEEQNLKEMTFHSRQSKLIVHFWGMVVMWWAMCESATTCWLEFRCGAQF